MAAAEEAAVERHIHIGDAPYDIQAAEMAGCVPIGVTTGIFSEDVLRKASKNPDALVVLSSLESSEVDALVL